MELFYRSPLNPKNLSLDKSVKCKIGDSISQHLMIIISTRMGELASLPDYGCKIWDYQFELLSSRYSWEVDVSEALVETIEKYEKRLTEVDAQIVLSEVEISHALRKYPDVKKQAKISITGTIPQLEEPYHFVTDVYLSPVSK